MRAPPFGDVKKDIHPNCYFVLDAIFTNCSPKIIHWKFYWKLYESSIRGCGKDIHPIECKISSLINFSQNNPLGTHWELIENSLGSSITDATSTCYHGIIECQISCLRNSTCFEKIRAYCIHPTNLNAFWDSDQFCAFDILHWLADKTIYYVPILLPLCTEDPTTIWSNV